MTPFSALLRKDLRVELRTLRSLPAMALFAVSAFVIFRFGLDRTTLDGGRSCSPRCSPSTACSSPSARRVAST